MGSPPKQAPTHHLESSTNQSTNTIDESGEKELESIIEYESVDAEAVDAEHQRLVAEFEQSLRVASKSSSRRLDKVFAKALNATNQPSKQVETLKTFEVEMLQEMNSKSRRLTRTPPPQLSEPLHADSALLYDDLYNSDVHSPSRSSVSPFRRMSPNSYLDKSLNQSVTSDYAESTSNRMIEPIVSENDMFPVSSGERSAESSPVSFSMSESVADSSFSRSPLKSEVKEEISSTAVDSYADDFDAEEDFPLHTVVPKAPRISSPIAPAAVSPVISIATVRNANVPSVSVSTQEFFDIFQSKSNHQISSADSIAPTISTRRHSASSANLNTETPNSSENYALFQSITSELIQVRQENALLRAQVETMQNSFDNAVRKEIEELEQELEHMYSEKLNNFTMELEDYWSKESEIRVKKAVEDERSRQRNEESRKESQDNSLELKLEIQRLQNQVHNLMEEKGQMQDHIGQCQADLEEARHQHDNQTNQIKQILAILEQSNEERSSMHELLLQEKSKTSRNEEEFKLFSKKLRSLQDLNGELRNENDELRTELRKLQYEGNASSEKDDYYKAKLDQLRYDNESLRAVIASLTNQQLDSSSTTSPPRTNPSPRYRQSVPDFRSNTSNPFPSTSSQSTTRESTPVKQAWTPQAQHQRPPPASFPRNSSITTGDRNKFLDKLKRYEEEDAEEEDIPDSRSFNSNFFRRSVGSTEGIARRNPITGDVSGQRGFGSAAGGLAAHGSGGRRVSVGSVGSSESYAEEPSVDYFALKTELDGQLRTLTDRKAALSSELQKIPTINSGSSRRRKEQLDDELDKVEKAIGGVRMKMRSMNLL
ncbi:hypothetical protein HDU79_007516 [Rhizoclosmatium sp. JEL0117]|nr:hypothetical protein HDU79_007516 [Rhizoclosmatium sp. JEL0117]